MEEQYIGDDGNIASGKSMKADIRTAGQHSQHKGEYNAKAFYSKDCIILKQPLLLAHT